MKTAKDICVLEVDDHPVVCRRTGCDYISGAGMTVVGQAPDGQRAVQIFKKRKPDVTLMDLKMPVTMASKPQQPSSRNFVTRASPC